jgi:hypothetical protein
MLPGRGIPLVTTDPVLCRLGGSEIGELQQQLPASLHTGRLIEAARPRP